MPVCWNWKPVGLPRSTSKAGLLPEGARFAITAISSTMPGRQLSAAVRLTIDRWLSSNVIWPFASKVMMDADEPSVLTLLKVMSRVISIHEMS